MAKAAVTPYFMQKSIEGLRKDTPLRYILKGVAMDLGITNWDDDLLNKPKTPALSDLAANKISVTAWIAQYFNPVFMAYVSGADDQTLLRIWRNTERFDQESMAIGRRHRHKNYTQGVMFVKTRQNNPRNWNYVK